MKILHIIESLGFGGAEFALVELARAQAANGHAVAICTLEGHMPLCANLDGSGIEVVTLGARRSANPLPKMRAFRDMVRRIDPDVVHSHLLHADLLVAASAPGRARRVTTLHNLIYQAHPVDSLPRRLKRAVHGLALRRGFDRYIAVSQAVATHYREHLGISVPETVFNPVSPDQPGVADRTELAGRFGLDPARRWIINPARLVIEKGQAGLISAFARLAEAHPDTQLVIAGSGPLEAELQSLAGRSQAAISFLGNIANSDLRQLYGEAEIGVLPSLSEGLPVALVEMMMAGLPIVASEIGGIPELIQPGATGLLVAAGDESALIAALDRLLGDRAFAQVLATAARAEAVRLCDPENVERRISAIYRS